MSEQERVITLIALLRRTSRRMVDEITERMEAGGFPDSPSRHHPVFENIDPEGTRLTVLADRAGISHQAMSEAGGELGGRGLDRKSTRLKSSHPKNSNTGLFL